MNNYVIIGVGALGKRHLQSLVELKDEADIYAVEVNEATISALRRDFPDARVVQSIEELPTEIKVAVIATSANVRRSVFEQLVKHAMVENIVFEKVLFQKVGDYEYVKNVLSQRGIKAWVNCARREWDSYKELRKMLVDDRECYISFIGGKWGMGCNSIHMLDLIEYLTRDEIQVVDLSKLERGLEESKRPGFYEFYGSITGSSNRCKEFSVTCIKDSLLPFIIEITTDRARYVIDEGKREMRYSSLETEWEWKKREFLPVYQSHMTARVVCDIVNNGTCALANYEESMKLHLKYILPLLAFFNENGMEGDLCPIT